MGYQPGATPSPFSHLDRLSRLEAILRQADKAERAPLPIKGGTLRSKGIVPVRILGEDAILKWHPVPPHEMRNDAAAYVVAKWVGLYSLVPVTVMTEMPAQSGGVGPVTVQLYVYGDEDGDLSSVPIADLRQAAAFDYLIATADRPGRNWFTVVDETGVNRVRLIDNGWSFDFNPLDAEVPMTLDELRVLKKGHPVGSSIIEAVADHGGMDLSVLRRALDTPVPAALRELVSEERIDRMLKRAEEALAGAA